ncbi:MAG: hypothetical protein WCW01_03780 [Gammaproteobacteria bacterium]
MKNKKFVKALMAVVIAMLGSTTAYAEVGECLHGQETLPSLICYGPATLNGTTVTGKVLVFGPLKATDSQIESLQVTGPTTLISSTVQNGVVVEGPFNVIGSKLANLEVLGPVTFSSSNVRGNVDIQGPISANKTKFTSSLRISSDKVTFISTTVDGSVIIKSRSEGPVLYLQNRSSVAGHVTFDGFVGTVKIDSDSKVNGQILNGKLGAVIL